MAAVVAVAAAVATIGGAIISTIGNIQKAQAQAKADELKAKQLKELSKSGGYYDQLLDSIHTELKDVEADRAAAGKLLAISSLEITRQEGQAKGHIAAAAGTGNLAQTGSIVQRKELVNEAVDIELAKSRLQYEDQLRSLAGRQVQATAQETRIKFEKKSGLQNAELLKDEAGWLETWGVGLSIGGGLAQIGTAVAGMNLEQAAQGNVTGNVTSPGFDPYSLMDKVPYPGTGSAPPYWTEY